MRTAKSWFNNLREVSGGTPGYLETVAPFPVSSGAVAWALLLLLTYTNQTRNLAPSVTTSILFTIFNNHEKRRLKRGRRLPQYFFHSRGPDVSQHVLDPKGLHLPDLASARLVAAETAADLLRSSGRKVWRGWLFEIADADGQITCIQPFPNPK